ncbi:MAG: LarC family nickel insertion protein [Geminicoccaceae bacterium]
MSPEGMRHLHLDPVGGVAGDMFVAALLDLAPDFDPTSLLEAIGLPSAIRVRRERTTDRGFAGSRLAISGEAPPPAIGATELLALVGASRLPAPVRARTLDMLQRLAEAEATVHGLTVAEVHFHELASWDTLIDLSLAAGLVELHGISSTSVGPLPLGGGTVASAHGALPVPAPATAQLLRGFRFVDDGVTGERVTPTGAAILAHLEPSPAVPASATLLATGAGFGTRRLPDRANQLRAMLLAPLANTAHADHVALIRFEIDDQTGEDLAIGLDRIRASDGVLDVVAWPVFGKKGRIASAVQVLAEPAALSPTIDACFSQTTTIGLRHELVSRIVLERATTMVEGLPTKEVVRPGGKRTRKVEADALADRAGDAGDREGLRQRLQNMEHR